MLCWCLQVLGTPTREDIHAMNPNYTEFKFPHIKAHPWSKVFSKRLPPDAVDLVRPSSSCIATGTSILIRYVCLQATAHSGCLFHSCNTIGFDDQDCGLCCAVLLLLCLHAMWAV